MNAPPACRSRARTNGFTLMEVAVSGALVAILSLCVFRGIVVVRQNAQVTALRIAAQGACLNQYETCRTGPICA